MIGTPNIIGFAIAGSVDVTLCVINISTFIQLFKVVRYVTFSNCQNWRSIKIFIYSYNIIRQPPGSRIEKRQCDVIMTS